MHWQSIKKWNCILWLSLITLSFTSSTNHKHLSYKQLDNTYLEDYNTQSFFKAELSEASIQLDNIDLELLNATLFFTLNKKRMRGRKKELHFNSSLIQTCKFIVEKYSSSGLQRFRNKRNRIKKLGKKYSEANNFKGTYTDIIAYGIPLLKIRGNQKYIYDNTLDEENVFFFKKKKKNSTPPKPISAYSYQSLIDTFISRSGGMSGIRNKSFSEFGCYIAIEQRTPKKIPHAKIVWMMGGYRLGLISE